MGYFEEPRELVSNVIKMNFTTGTTGGHDAGTSTMVDVSVDDRAASSAGSPPSANNQRANRRSDRNS